MKKQFKKCLLHEPAKKMAVLMLAKAGIDSAGSQLRRWVLA